MTDIQEKAYQLLAEDMSQKGFHPVSKSQIPEDMGRYGQYFQNKNGDVVGISVSDNGTANMALAVSGESIEKVNLDPNKPLTSGGHAIKSIGNRANNSDAVKKLAIAADGAIRTALGYKADTTAANAINDRHAQKLPEWNEARKVSGNALQDIFEKTTAPARAAALAAMLEGLSDDDLAAILPREPGGTSPLFEALLEGKTDIPAPDNPEFLENIKKERDRWVADLRGADPAGAIARLEAQAGAGKSIDQLLKERTPSSPPSPEDVDAGRTAFDALIQKPHM